MQMIRQLAGHMARFHRPRPIGLRQLARYGRQQILERASEHIFSTGLGDGSSLLARENMKWGLAKLHWIQETFGLPPNATFISTPDESVTRNVHRWEAGISYGGKLSWGPGNEPIIPLNSKPNACGLLLGGLDVLPKADDVVARLYEFEHKDSYIENVRVRWDFNVGNHFIDVFELRPSPNFRGHLPKYAVIIHAGCPELKGDNSTRYGFGLYWHKSQQLLNMAEEIKTPFGFSYVLTDENARRYYDFVRFALRYAAERRRLIYQDVFGGKRSKMICNKTHQALLNMNEHILGCQEIKSERELLPISIRADMPSWLVHGHRNFTPQQIEALGWKDRALRHGVMGRLRRTNLLPHGGGYLFQDTLRVERVIESGGKRFFVIDLVDGIGKKIVLNVTELEFGYRSGEVMQRVEELGMAKVVAEMLPLYTIKI